LNSVEFNTIGKAKAFILGNGFICMSNNPKGLVSHDSVFGINDIRGQCPKQIDSKFAERLGKSISQFFGKGKVIIGFDARTNSPKLAKALAKGFASQGSNVLMIGMCSTPMLYFACNFLKAKASVMVTASHNPSSHAGFKITGENAISINRETGLNAIQTIFELDDFKEKNKGTIKNKSIWKDYRKYLLFMLKIKKPVKIVVDGGNSTPSIDAKRIFKGTKVKVIFVNKKIIHNQKKTSNPLVDSSKDAIATVKKRKAKLGACFDFDGDRVFFIDEKGKKLSGYASGGILTESIVNEGGIVVCDNRFDRRFEEIMAEKNIKMVISQVGHSKIKAKMRKTNADFALEFSGHYYFKDNFYTDSGIVALINMISLLEKKKQPLSLLAKKYTKYYSTGELNYVIKEKDKAIAAVSNAFLGGTRNLIDGVRVDYDDWWFIIRQSQTQSLLRIIVSGKNKKIVDSKKKLIVEIIKKYK
jgi:phosphomannomutase